MAAGSRSSRAATCGCTDLRREVRTLVASGVHGNAHWTPDSRYDRVRHSGDNVWKPADGAGPPVPLLPADPSVVRVVTSVRNDGRRLGFDESRVGGGSRGWDPLDHAHPNRRPRAARRGARAVSRDAARRAESAVLARWPLGSLRGLGAWRDVRGLRQGLPRRRPGVEGFRRRWQFAAVVTAASRALLLVGPGDHRQSLSDRQRRVRPSAGPESGSAGRFRATPRCLLARSGRDARPGSRDRRGSRGTSPARCHALDPRPCAAASQAWRNQR